MAQAFKLWVTIPMLEDNTYIGPGARPFGPISIANNVAIGGIPAKKIPDHIDIDNLRIRVSMILTLKMDTDVLAPDGGCDSN